MPLRPSSLRYDLVGTALILAATSSAVTLAGNGQPKPMRDILDRSDSPPSVGFTPMRTGLAVSVKWGLCFWSISLAPGRHPPRWDRNTPLEVGLVFADEGGVVLGARTRKMTPSVSEAVTKLWRAAMTDADDPEADTAALSEHDRRWGHPEEVWEAAELTIPL